MPCTNGKATSFVFTLYLSQGPFSLPFLPGWMGPSCSPPGWMGHLVLTAPALPWPFQADAQLAKLAARVADFEAEGRRTQAEAGERAEEEREREAQESISRNQLEEGTAARVKRQD
eukprot:7878719-Pyramimonas_sp.AAC.1